MMVRDSDGEKIRLSGADWAGLAAVALTVIGALVWNSMTVARIGTLVETHDQRIVRLEDRVFAESGK